MKRQNETPDVPLSARVALEALVCQPVQLRQRGLDVSLLTRTPRSSRRGPFPVPQLTDAAAIEDDEPLLPYERQPDESSVAWAAFQAYRNLGPRRSLTAVERLMYPPMPPEEPQKSHTPEATDVPRRRRGSLGRWSRQYEWVARAAAWDSFLDREARLTQVEEVRHMNKRHAIEARALQAKAIEALRVLGAGDLDATDVVRCLIEGSKLERLSLGEVTDAVRQEQRSESRMILEVVERIVLVKADVVAPAMAALAPPPATGGADAEPFESLAADEIVDADIGELSLPNELRQNQ